MSENNIYIGGIEGGATHSTIIILNSRGCQVSMLKAEGTNHWIIGMDECQRRIVDMVNRAKTEAGIPLDKPLAALGLSLSGCEQEESNLQLEENIRKANPLLTKSYVVCSDTSGSLATAEPEGGVVLIAGTGSNALLINPDGSKYQCGGWGHILGDEGSAWWISHRAVKTVFDHLDNFKLAPYPIKRVWNEIKIYFNIETQSDLLDHCYNNFNKSFFAGLCVRLAKLAKEGDELSRHLFYEAGQMLARSIEALYPRAHQSLLVRKGGLHIVCVGSVWLSFDLLERGFVEQLRKNPNIGELSMLRLKASGAIGASYLAADSINFSLPKNYNNNYSVFYHYNNKN